ncbi:MAG TPA: signal peptidase II [Ktedonobacterales bacterium]|nr:signal peptidase II [Ktedonobacterales bacterium]
MKNRPYLYDVVMLLVGIIVISLDQWSKAAIRQHFGICDTSAYIPFPNDHFGLVYVCNNGAAFSLFAQGNALLLFAFIAIALAVIIWLYIYFSKQPSLLLKISFGLILGGAIGNLIDRFRLGYVTDFLMFSIKQIGFTFAIFNLADSSICIGIFLLMIYLWRRPTIAKRAPDTQNPDPTLVEPSPAERSSQQI